MPAPRGGRGCSSSAFTCTVERTFFPRYTQIKGDPAFSAERQVPPAFPSCGLLTARVPRKTLEMVGGWKIANEVPN